MPSFSTSRLNTILRRTGLCAVVVLVSGVGPTIAQDTESFTRGDMLKEYVLGVYLQATGEYLASVDHLEYAWRMSGHDPSVGIKLAESYYTLKNFTRCEMVLDDMLDRPSHDAGALMLKAKVRYIKRDREGAVLCLEQVREHHPGTFEAERLLGNIYYEMGEAARALDAYERCLAVDAAYPYIQFRYGLLLQESGRSVDAERALRRAMSLDDSFDEPALALAELLVAQSRMEEAVDVLETVVLREGYSGEGVMTLVELYVAAGNAKAGIDLLEAQRRDTGLSREGEILLGRLYFDSNQYAAAEAIFKDLFRAESNSAELARILAEIRLQAGDPAGARQYFERAIAIAPRDYRGYLGMYFAGADRFTSGPKPIELTDDDRSLLLNEAARLIAPDDFDGNYMIGIAYQSADSLSAAQHHLELAVAERETDRGALLNLSNVYEKQRRFKDAITLVARLHAETPTDPTVLNFYGYLLAEAGEDLERAETMVRQALSTDPGNGYYLDSLGWVYYQMGDYSRAVIELEKASAYVPDDPVVLEHLGDAYAAMRNFDKAITAYEQSNRLQGGSDVLNQKIESVTRQR